VRDAERWQRVQAIFHEALSCAPEDRAALLDRAGDQDPALRAEVESLLASHREAGRFLSPSPAGSSESGAAREPLDSIDPIESIESVEGRIVGPYVLRREIGRGGMGVVYLALDTRLGREVALKTLPSAFRLDPRRVERLRIEARAAAGLSHPGIAAVFALEELDGTLWLAHEYVPGPTLRQVLDARGALPEDEVLALAAQLADALTAAHDRGVVHRDLKPENIIVTGGGRVKVLDFGLARLLEPWSEHRVTEAGVAVGTPAYMAPEQLLGRDVDFTADLFAFGIILAELASGSHPFAFDDAGDGGRVDRAARPALPRLGTGLRAGVERVVDTCLQRDPRRRYARTSDLVADLQALRSGRPVRGGGDGRWWWQFHQLAVAVVYAAVLFPAWMARASMPLGAGTPLFFLLLTAAVTAASLRLHLWFQSRVHPADVPEQLVRVRAWLCGTDRGAALLLFGFGQFAASEHAVLATALVIVAVASFVVSVLIEPATTRAAFPSDDHAPS
jgi:serine/threonine protein kinase